MSAVPHSNAVPPPARLSGRALFALVLLTSLYVLAAVDRQILAVMVGPIRSRFGLSDTDLGILAGSAFAVVYALAALPAARLADRQRRTTLIAAGLALWSLCTGLFALARTWWQLVLCRVGVGLGEACLSPAALSLLADYFPPRHVGKAVAVYILAVPAGSGLTGVFGGVMLGGLLPVDGIFGTLEPWQILLLLLSGAGFGLLLLFVLGVREPARTRGAAAAEPAAADHSLAAFGQQLRTHAALYGALALVMLTSALLYFGVGYWMPSYFTRNVQPGGLQAGELLVYWGMISLVFGALGVLAGGVLADRLSARHPDGMWRTLGIGTLLAGVGFTTFHFGAAQQLSLLLLVPGVFGNGILQAAGITAVVKIAPNHMRGQLSALYFLLVNLVGAGLGPTLIAWLGESVFGGGSGLALAMALSTLVMCAASLLMLARTAAAARAV